MPKSKRTTQRDEALVRLILDTLDDMKAERVVDLDVRHLTSVTDHMIVASGRSDRHVRAIADAVLERCEAAGIQPLGVEGQEAGEWVLVDLADAIVHVMLPRVREFYNIENLWDMSSARDESAGIA
jgi:ribosome-associated protein